MGVYLSQLFAPLFAPRRRPRWPTTYFGFETAAARVDPGPDHSLATTAASTAQRTHVIVSTITEGSYEDSPSPSVHITAVRLTTAQRQIELAIHRDVARVEMLAHEIVHERRAVDSLIRELGLREATVKVSNKTIADGCATPRPDRG
jgi:hypothetical protein